MFKNYIKIAWRNILKNKIYSFINIAGLAIGIAATLLILQYVFFERSYEKFHDDVDQIYRLTQDRYDKGELINSWAGGAFGPARAFSEAIPEIEQYVKLYKDDEGTVITVNGEPVKIDNLFFASEEFFNVFSYEVLHGDQKTVLSDPRKIAISETTANIIFGKSNAVGESISLDGDDPYIISGVFKDMPANTHIHPNILIPFKRFLEFAPSAATNWFWDGCSTYFKMQKDADPSEVEAKFSPIVDAAVGEELQQYNSSVEYHLQPLLDIHLNSSFFDELEMTGDSKTVNLLMIVAFFILFIAWINYVNLATARAIGRAKEVGVRKTVGSSRQQLITQFFFESALFNVLSFALALVIMTITIPAFNQISGQDMSYSLFAKAPFWLGITGLFMVSMFFSGLYPAFILSSFKPVDVLKGKLHSTKKGAALRKTLVVVQFAASLFLLIGSYTVYKQIQFMRNQSLGIDIDQTLIVEQPIVVDSTFGVQKQAFQNALRQYPTIKSVSVSSFMPGQGGGDNAGGIRLVSETDADQKQYKFLRVDQNFVNQFGLKVIAGRPFSPERDNNVGPVIFNRLGAKKLGFPNPEEAINKRIEFWGTQYDVVGVVENFHQISLRDNYEPMILVLVPQVNGHVAIKSSVADMSQTIAYAEKEWNKFFPGNTFDYSFLDENYDRQYAADKRFGKVFGIFTILAIIVACLGLFGLASFTALQRKKEIGIRKVLGASVPDILKLLFKEYTSLLIIAFVLSIPFAWWMIDNWLQGYAFRINLHWIYFTIPFIGISLIALGTVSFQAIKSALSNPVKSLRTE